MGQTAFSGITSCRGMAVKKKGSEKDVCKRLMETEERHIDSLSSRKHFFGSSCSFTFVPKLLVNVSGVSSSLFRLPAQIIFFSHIQTVSRLIFEVWNSNHIWLAVWNVIRISTDTSQSDFWCDWRWENSTSSSKPEWRKCIRAAEQNSGCYEQSGMEVNTESNSSVERSWNKLPAL